MQDVVLKKILVVSFIPFSQRVADDVVNQKAFPRIGAVAIYKVAEHVVFVSYQQIAARVGDASQVVLDVGIYDRRVKEIGADAILVMLDLQNGPPKRIEMLEQRRTVMLGGLFGGKFFF